MSGLLLAEGTNVQPRLFTQHLLRGLEVHLDGHAMTVGARTLEVNPSPSSTTAYFAIGRPFSGVNLSSLMYTVVVTSVTGTVTFRPCTRIFGGFEETPGDWTLQDSATSKTDNDQVNQQFALTTDNAMIQAGLAITSTTATATLQAMVVAAM